MTIIHDPKLGLDCAKSAAQSRPANPFMAPELFVPSEFGIDRCTPTKEADIYALAMVIYQVLAARLLAHGHVDSFNVGTHRNAAIR